MRLARILGRQTSVQPLWFFLVVMLATAAALIGNRRTVAAQAPHAEAIIDGTLEVQIQDFAGGSRVNHFLDADDGRRVRLQFPGDGPGLLSGTRVRARGQLANGTLTLTSDASVSTLALALPNSFGDQHTLVILVNFTNDTSQPYNPQAASAVTFGQTDNFYIENSYGQASLSGDVVGWYTIAYDSSKGCDTSKIATLAEQAALKANPALDLSIYPHRIYGFPFSAMCKVGTTQWWGYSTIGGNPARSWINGSYQLSVVSHEFGHGLGLWHSRANICDSGSCTVLEYGDDHDTMGGLAGHFNAYQKERLGWLNYSVSPPILTLSSSAAQWLEPYETTSGGFPKAVKMLYKSSSSGKTYLYAEARTQRGFDGALATGVLIHTGVDTNATSSLEQDLAPLSTTTDLMLDPGQSITYLDGIQPITITTLSADNTGALVDVVLEPIPCVTATPTVAVSPSAIQWSPSGSTMNYSVSVTNNDSFGCTSSPFAVAATSTLPTGWSATFDNANPTIAPGDVATTVAHVTSPATTSGAQYQNTFSAVDGNTSYLGTTSVFEWVATKLDIATGVSPANPTLSKPVTLTANVMIGQAPVPGAAVTFTVRDPGGNISTYNATTSSTGTASVTFRFNRKKDGPGTYQIMASANKSGILGTNTINVAVQ